MNRATYQTVRLGKGKHSSPEHGVCVMELASMLAGERFSDHPRSVCRVIGAFLRGYNDLIDDERRQDLYRYAAEVVGTAGPPELESLRAERLAAWVEELATERRGAVLARIRRAIPRRRRPTGPEMCARAAIMALRKPSDTTHCAVLRVLDELIDTGIEAMMEPRCPSRVPLRSEPKPVEAR